FPVIPGQDKGLGFSMDPNLHYFFSPHWSVGTSLHFDGYFKSGPQFLGIQPQLRYYINPQNPHLNWFLFLAPRWEFVLDRELGRDYPVQSHFDLSGGAGLSVFLTPNVVWQSKASIYHRGRNDQYAFSYEMPLILESGLS